MFNFNKTAYPYFSIDVIEGEFNGEANLSGNAQKLELTKYINTDNYTEQDKNLITQVRKLQDAEISKYISRNSPFSGIWENIVHHEDDTLPEETKHLINEYLLPKMRKLFSEEAPVAVFILPAKKKLQNGASPENRVNAAGFAAYVLREPRKRKIRGRVFREARIGGARPFGK